MPVKLLIACLTVSCIAYAQTGGEAPKDEDRSAVTAPHASQKRVLDAKYWALAGGLVFASIYNVELTRECYRTPGCHVVNVSVPVVSANRLAAYPVVAAGDGGIMYLAYRMKRSHGFIRHFWWAPPAVGTMLHLANGTSNFIISFTLRI